VLRRARSMLGTSDLRDAVCSCTAKLAYQLEPRIYDWSRIKETQHTTQAEAEAVVPWNHTWPGKHAGTLAQSGPWGKTMLMARVVLLSCANSCGLGGCAAAACAMQQSALDLTQSLTSRLYALYSPCFKCAAHTAPDAMSRGTSELSAVPRLAHICGALVSDELRPCWHSRCGCFCSDAALC